MANQLIRSALAQLVIAAMIIGASKAHAAEIKVIAGAAVREAYLELVPNFEKSSGHKVTTIWDGTENIIKRINDGEVADIVILGAPTIDKLIAEGKLSWSRIPELGDLVTGRVVGRADRDEINIFRESQGGYGDVIFAAWLYEEAVRRGLGKKMEL